MPNRVSHVENLVGDFGGAPEIPGNNGAVGRVPARGICAAQKLGAFPEEEDVQGLLDGGLVASHHLQEWAPVMPVGPRGTGRVPQTGTRRAAECPEGWRVWRGWCWKMRPQAEEPKRGGGAAAG